MMISKLIVHIALNRIPSGRERKRNMRDDNQHVVNDNNRSSSNRLDSLYGADINRRLILPIKNPTCNAVGVLNGRSSGGCALKVPSKTPSELLTHDGVLVAW